MVVLATKIEMLQMQHQVLPQEPSYPRTGIPGQHEVGGGYLDVLEETRLHPTDDPSGRLDWIQDAEGAAQRSPADGTLVGRERPIEVAYAGSTAETIAVHSLASQVTVAHRRPDGIGRHRA
jgi:hypothetical protein